MARVVSIKICEEKGAGRKDVNEGYFKVDHGLDGDVYSQAGDRQVNIMCLSTREFVQNHHMDGHCFHNFIETILIDGVDLYEYEIGTRFKIGEAVMEISKKGKRCWPECHLVKEREVCKLKNEPIFAKVIKAGAVKLGDNIEII
ncbi:MAG: MOSC domain-containing protein [Firmicutes bacterium]|jgi:MOSC domain-containing protein YiiM|nr:MOSC domain-containing protein [Bacillota bacterium]